MRAFFKYGMFAAGLLYIVLFLTAKIQLVQAGTSSYGGLGALELHVLGKKYDGQPEAVRVHRLEEALKLRNDPGFSERYRLARLYQVQESIGVLKQRQLAISAYNEGIEYETMGQNDHAIAAYRKSIQYDSGLIQAYNNLAHLLFQNNQYEETIQLYQKAIKLKPNDPLLHRNLGILYEKLGKIQDAIAEYEIYLRYAVKPDPPIQAIVDNYKIQRKAGMGVSDYLAAATHSSRGQPLVWPGNINPIRVFVKVSKSEQLFALPLIQRSMDDWAQATNNRLTFKQVMWMEDANILIQLQDGPLMDPYANIGHAEYHMPEDQLFQHKMNFVKIALNTGLLSTNNTLPLENRREQFYRMALHELGHAIGIWGHSSDPGDIMFTHPIATGLSQRDIRTVRKLYGLASE